MAISRVSAWRWPPDSRPHPGRQAALQPQIQGLEQFPVFLPLLFGDADAEGAGLAAAGGQGQVLLDLHGGGGAGHGVLEHPADVFGALVFAEAGDIGAVDGDAAVVHRPDAGHRIEHGGLAGAVAADDGDEIALVEVEGQAVQGGLFVHRAGIEGL